MNVKMNAGKHLSLSLYGALLDGRTSAGRRAKERARQRLSTASEADLRELARREAHLLSTSPEEVFERLVKRKVR